MYICMYRRTPCESKCMRWYLIVDSLQSQRETFHCKGNELRVISSDGSYPLMDLFILLNRSCRIQLCSIKCVCVYFSKILISCFLSPPFSFCIFSEALVYPPT
uniref:Uncharacterized protein n=1 Tax=Cacopsylla melanoneura TaxID=428564 RepID=A0A8D8YG65_9HEMI